MSALVEIQKRLDALLGPALLWTTRRPSHPAGPPAPRRLLFVKFWGLGNLTMLLPVAAAARRTWPDAEITFLTLEENVPFVRAHGAVDEAVGVPRRPTLQALSALARFAARRRGVFDLVIDAEPFLYLSAALVRRLRPAYSVGFRTPGRLRHLAHDVSVPLDPARHIALSFADLGRAVGAFGDRPLEDPKPCSPRFPEVAADLPAWLAATGLSPERPLVVLHPGSGDHVLGRRWPARRFAAVGRRIVRSRRVALAVTGTAPERALADFVAAEIGGGAVSLAGRLDVPRFVELLARAALVVTNDTAPAHLAAALGRPVVALFGPNHPALYGPLGPRVRALHAGLPCSPCITNRNAKTTWCRRTLCLEMLDVSFVAAAALAELTEPGAPAGVDRAADVPARAGVSEQREAAVAGAPEGRNP